jgi:hypothetical protein
MGTKLHICELALKDLSLGVGRLRNQKLEWPWMKGLEYGYHWLWWEIEKKRKWKVIIHNVPKSTMLNKGPPKGLHWWVPMVGGMWWDHFFGYGG